MNVKEGKFVIERVVLIFPSIVMEKRSVVTMGVENFKLIKLWGFLS
jgi:hypothetical protein